MAECSTEQLSRSEQAVTASSATDQHTASATMFVCKNTNLLQTMPHIKEEIGESVIIALDTEMSGIGSNRLNASFDTLEDRYRELREVVRKHSIIQLGITFFRHDKKTMNKYIGSTYTFYLFDGLNKRIDQEPCGINFNYKSFHFLIANMFNIKEWSQDGLYFVRGSNREKFEQNFDSYIEACCSDFNREVTNDIFYIVSWLRQYKFEKSLYAQSTKGVVEYECKNRLRLKFRPTKNELFNYYFLMKIRKFLLERESIKSYLDDDEYLWCDNYRDEHYFVTVAKRVGREQEQTPSKNVVERKYNMYIGDVQELHDLMIADKEELIAKILSFSTMFSYISQSKALIVGHNFLLDLLFIYHNFFEQLPGTLAEFQKNIQVIFPKVFDTKFIAQQERSLKLRYTSLLDSFQLICLKREAFRNCLPDIFIRTFNDSNRDRDDYMNALDLKRYQKIEAHNAGFDSFITGFLFLYFGFIIMRQARPITQRKSDRQIMCDYRIFLENAFKFHLNKLHLAKNCNQPLCLAPIADKTEARPRFYSKIVLSFQTNHGLSIFQKSLEKKSNIDVQQVSKFKFIIGATHPDKIETFLYGLANLLKQKKETMSIKKHDAYEKYSTFRKFSWFAFLSSATCFAFLFTQFLLNSE